MTTKQLNQDVMAYVRTFSLMLFLTLITFLWPVFIELDIHGVFVTQVLIASAKAYFILAFFMHLKNANDLIKMIIMFAGAALLTFFIIVGIDSRMDDSPRDMFQTQMEKGGHS